MEKNNIFKTKPGKKYILKTEPEKEQYFQNSTWKKIYFLKTEPEKKTIFSNLNLGKNTIFKTQPGKKKMVFSKLDLQKKKKKKIIKVITISKIFCNIDEYKHECRIIVNWLELS